MNLKSSASVSPKDVSGVLAEARNCSARYDFRRAAELLERAHKQEPTSERLLLELGSIHARAHDFQAAEKAFEMALSISSRKTDARNVIAHAWIDVRNYEAAKKQFEQIVEQETQPPVVTLAKLADIYIRIRRLDDALAIAERAVHFYPQQEAALLTRAKVHRQKKEFDAAEKLCRRIVSNAQCDPQGRAAAWYELAAAYDQQEQYDQAMQAAIEAKSLMRLSAGHVLKVGRMKEAQLKEMSSVNAEALVQRWRKAGQTDLQPARKLSLLCGHPRSGTTLLEYVLDSHPQVVSADETSVFHHAAYFPISRHISANTPYTSVLDWMPARELRQVRTDYFRGIDSFLGNAVGERLLVDKNPANTFDIPAVARIFPETKFIVALRDPRDVCLSCFMQPVPMLPDTAFWLSLEGTITHYGLIMNLWLAWKKALGNAAIEVKYEDMVSDQQKTSERVLQFLDLPWDERVLRFHEHAQTKVIRSPTFAEVSKPIYKTAVARWKNYEKHFAPHLEKLTSFLKAFGYE